jgi:hypothetical protein
MFLALMVEVLPFKELLVVASRAMKWQPDQALLFQNDSIL